MNTKNIIILVLAILLPSIFGVLAYSWIIDQSDKMMGTGKYTPYTYEDCTNYWNNTDGIETIKLGFNQTVQEYCEDLK